MSASKQRQPRSTASPDEVKPYKGEINVIRKVSAADGKAYKPEIYGPNLGYLYIVDFLDHPVFRGLNAYGGNTSLVVSEDAEGNVETLNTRYKIKGRLDVLPQA